jgi:hypothetical protein
MISESAREKEKRAERGYWAEWQKYYHQSDGDVQTRDERRRAWHKSADQWDKAIRNRAMAEGEDLS